MNQPFHSIYTHGFIRASICLPEIKVADPEFNTKRTLELAQQAASKQATLALFPELGISGYSCEDLHQQDALLDACEDALREIKLASNKINTILIVGLPWRTEGAIFNCGFVIYDGQILGAIAKSYLPNYREFYEKRQFTAAREAISSTIQWDGEEIPFGNDLVFDCINIKEFKLFGEICEDLWTTIPPSSYGALGGATILVNLSASNITIGKADYRRKLCEGQSGRCVAAYLYAAAGPGESTTDLAWDGHALIAENGEVLQESERFCAREQIIMNDIDVGRLIQERMRQGSFHDSAKDCQNRLQKLRYIPFNYRKAETRGLIRAVERRPYIPNNPALRNERCYEAYNIQVHGLMKRLKQSGVNKLVIGVSGGLDSTQALIIAAKTMDRMGLPRTNILGYTLPGLATSKFTNQNAWKLMRALRITAEEINITRSCEAMYADIGHPYAKGEPVYDSTFENVQAGQRTSVLFRLAGQNNALVLGTGDLSELALGWCTYGVGDHISHYNVNTSTPKTLIKELILWVSQNDEFDKTTNAVLTDILGTEISPELIPGKNHDGQPAQKTEEKMGPYDLQDFTLYYLTRFGFRPQKIAYLANHAWAPEYDLGTIKKWMRVFMNRFFANQYKRSVAVNGPKVGSGGSLSPRGDWRAPSDAESRVWQADVERIPDIDELRRRIAEEQYQKFTQINPEMDIVDSNGWENGEDPDELTCVYYTESHDDGPSEKHTFRIKFATGKTDVVETQTGW